MLRKILILGIALGLLSSARSTQAIWVNLTPEQIQEAIAYGKSTKEKELREEWRIGMDLRNGTLVTWEFYIDDLIKKAMGQSSTLSRWISFVEVKTEFREIALQARKAFIQYRELSPAEIKEAIAKVQDKLIFDISTNTNILSFVKDYHAVIECKGKIIQPIYKNNDVESWATAWSPESPQYCAKCVYAFPINEIDPDSQITLILIRPHEGEVHFPFDLSKMR